MNGYVLKQANGEKKYTPQPPRAEAPSPCSTRRLMATDEPKCIKLVSRLDGMSTWTSCVHKVDNKHVVSKCLPDK